MAMIPKMEAMGFKQQPQMLARGGMVRGPGTGTSDSIPDEVEPDTFIMPADSTAAIGPSALEKMGTVPVRLSDGEMKIPPEQVMAIGAAVLKLLKLALTVVAIPVAAVVGIAITLGRAVLKVATTIVKVVLAVVLSPLRLLGIGRRKERVEYVEVHDASEAKHVPDAA